MGRPAVDPVERFWAKVQKSAGCWEWIAGKDKDGYGLHHVAVGKSPARAHRFSYELVNGPITDGLHIDHLCRNRACVRPDHLEPVTCRENLLRGDGFAATNAAKTHCPKGHEYTPENTYVRKRMRSCRECKRQKDRERYRAKKSRAATGAHA